MKKFRKMLYLKLARIGRGSATPVPSIISFGTKIKGNISDGDVIHVDGRIEGDICCEELIIGLKGQILGRVKAKTLSVYGLLQGTAEAENVFVAGNARINGDIYHKSLAVEPGAFIEGRCVRTSKGEGEAVKEKEAIQPSVKSNKVIEDPNLFKAVAGGK